MRTRFLPKLLNNEVEEYFAKGGDTIIVPVGTVEMHGGLPLDSETVISEAIALEMAKACDGLVLSGLQYFYAGATASGRGTVQVSIQQGMAYLNAVAHSLLRQGFKRQVYISFHGPAHMTCSPMVRDFYDETGTPILYIDLMMELMDCAKDLFTSIDSFHAMVIGAYKMLGRLEDVPLTTEHFHTDVASVDKFNDIFKKAYQSGSIGYYFSEPKEHMSTSLIPDIATREKLANEGIAIIKELIKRMDMHNVVNQMAKLQEHQDSLKEKYPWLPSVYNK